jgi:hypothetical protein
MPADHTEAFVSQTSVPPNQSAGPATSRGNKRATVRYRCAPATIGKLYVTDDHEFQHAWILNLSVSGMGLVLTRPINSGSFVIIHIKSNDGTKTYELTAHVAHCTALPHGEWSVGCELVHSLSPEDLDLLL